MLRSVSGLVATLVLVIGAQAQDTLRLQRAIDALSSPPGADEIAALGASDANAYVYFVQDFLRGKGTYGGAVDGQLTNAAIRAIIAYCREAGFAETCSRGPLLPQSIAAVSGAIAAALAPAGVDPGATTPAAEAAAEPTEPVATPAAAPMLPEGWHLNDNGGRGSLGLAVELVSAGRDEAEVRFSGTATRDGYFNIELAPNRPAAAGTWVTEVTAARESAADTTGETWLRTARMNEKSYLGELFPGVPINAGAEATTLSGAGTLSADTTRLLPYVQLWVRAGDRIDTTLYLADPSLVATP